MDNVTEIVGAIIAGFRTETLTSKFPVNEESFVFGDILLVFDLVTG